MTGVSTLHAVLQKTRKVKPEKQNTRPGPTKMMDAARGSEDPIVIREEEDDAPVDLTAIPEAPPEGDNEPLFLPRSDSEDDSEDDSDFPPTRKRKQKEVNNDDSAEHDDKKKLRFNTEYEGFAIYGKVLCLIVTRKKNQEPEKRAPGPAVGGGLIEGWIAMSQAVRAGEGTED